MKNAVGKASLSERVIALIESARQKVASAANLAQVYTNYEIGRQIVEEEQGGKRRAGYGEKIIEELSSRLTARYGKGWGARSLRNIRKFYVEYSTDEIRKELIAESEKPVLDISVIDLKIGAVSHKDLGQMQTYVHYYDRMVKQPDENPTIGILLCSDDNKALVEMTLPEAEQRQIFARRYSAIIPSKVKLASIVREEQEKFEKEKLLALAASKSKGRAK